MPERRLQEDVMPYKHTAEQKAEAVRELLGGVAIPKELRIRYNASEKEVRHWLDQAIDCVDEVFQDGGARFGGAEHHQAILSEYELKFLLGDGH